MYELNRRQKRVLMGFLGVGILIVLIALVLIYQPILSGKAIIVDTTVEDGGFVGSAVVKLAEGRVLPYYGTQVEIVFNDYITGQDLKDVLPVDAIRDTEFDLDYYPTLEVTFSIDNIKHLGGSFERGGEQNNKDSVPAGGGDGGGGGGAGASLPTSLVIHDFSDVKEGTQTIEVNGYLPVEIILPPGKYAKVQEVKLGGKDVDSNLVEVSQEGDVFKITTTRVDKKVVGFTGKEVLIPLENFGFLVQGGDNIIEITIRDEYGQVLDSVRKNFFVSALNPEIVGKKEIPEITDLGALDVACDKSLFACQAPGPCTMPSLNEMVIGDSITPHRVSQCQNGCGEAFVQTDACSFSDENDGEIIVVPKDDFAQKDIPERIFNVVRVDDNKNLGVLEFSEIEGTEKVKLDITFGN